MQKLLKVSKTNESITSYPEAKCLLALNFQQYNTLKASASLSPHKFLEDLATTKALDTGIQQATILKQLQLLEKQCDHSCKVKNTSEKIAGLD